MSSDRWRRSEELYQAALKLKARESAAFLQEACTGDEALRQEVESLLAHQPQAASFIETPAMEVTAP